MLLLRTILLIALVITLPAKALDRTQIATQPEFVTPLLNGQQIPDVRLQNVQGDWVELQSLVAEKPTVILFYRGGWCPYCNRQLAGLKPLEKRFTELGYQILAISPDTPERLKEQQTKEEFAVTLLSDNKLDAIRAFGIGFALPEAMAKRYNDMIGAKLATTDGDKVVLPAPAVFIADQKGLIQFQYVNPNFKVRVSPELLYHAAKLAL